MTIFVAKYSNNELAPKMKPEIVQISTKRKYDYLFLLISMDNGMVWLGTVWNVPDHCLSSLFAQQYIHSIECMTVLLQQVITIELKLSWSWLKCHGQQNIQTVNEMQIAFSVKLASCQHQWVDYFIALVVDAMSVEETHTNKALKTFTNSCCWISCY